jgi:DNA adenine methylase
MNLMVSPDQVKVSRPVMRYQGGKWRLAPFVLRHFPPHSTYLELFGGSAAVLLRKDRARSEIYNDLSSDVVRTFLAIRRHPAELARAIALTPYARSEYETLYEPTDCDIEAARRFIARSFMGQNSKGAFKRSGFDARNNVDHFIARLRSLAAVPDQVAIVAGRLSQVLFENRDALELIAQYATPETLIYADPPYLGKRNYYQHPFGIQRHQALLTALQACSAMVVVSGYPSPLYTEMLTGWQMVCARARTDTTSSSSARTEVLWLNPAASRQLIKSQRPEGER